MILRVPNVEAATRDVLWKMVLLKFSTFQAYNFIKKKIQNRYFPVKFAKFLGTSILKNICQQLLLQMLFPWFLLLINNIRCHEILIVDM